MRVPNLVTTIKGINGHVSISSKIIFFFETIEYVSS